MVDRIDQVGIFVQFLEGATVIELGAGTALQLLNIFERLGRAVLDEREMKQSLGEGISTAHKWLPSMSAGELAGCVSELCRAGQRFREQGHGYYPSEAFYRDLRLQLDWLRDEAGSLGMNPSAWVPSSIVLLPVVMRRHLTAAGAEFVRRVAGALIEHCPTLCGEDSVESE